MFKKVKMKIVLKIALTALVALFVYEAFAVLAARSKTPEIFSAALKGGDVKIHLSDLSKERINALLSVQDPRFYEHSGFDFNTPGAGVTTITQAMAKYLYFENFTPGFKKIEQTLIAWLAITPLVSKNNQLTVFINTAYMGHVHGEEIRGFAEASIAYYGKQFEELSETEYLSIVAMLIAPKKFSIKNQSERNSERVILIKKLLKGEYILVGNGDLFYGQRI